MVRRRGGAAASERWQEKLFRRAPLAGRLEELRINLENSVTVSPVDGFIGRRYLDRPASR